ncbi:MAG: tetratricopeptide repeat protein [Candidatus Omnitrophica bacterium]|nr:tetratricopeptide repeat protein [Candidatus Omnitrophota bacterium]
MDVGRIVQDGIEYYNKGDYDKAIRCYLDALQINNITDKGKANIYFNIGLSYWKKNDLKQTEKFYLLSIKHNSEYIPALSDLGKLYYDMSEYKKAKSCFLRVLKLDLEYPNVIYGMALVSHVMKDYSAAIKYAEEYFKYGQNEEFIQELKLLITDCNLKLKKIIR